MQNRDISRVFRRKSAHTAIAKGPVRFVLSSLDRPIHGRPLLRCPSFSVGAGEGTGMADCRYPCAFHKGKIEWHHPIAEKPAIGLYLCEAHHSIIQGRKKRYAGEMIIDKSLDQMKTELKRLEHFVIQEADQYAQADKH